MIRIPSESALSREQKEVIAAPAEGTILVTGPPGSGKTIVALMRQRALKRQKEPVTALVFNNVLTRYTGNEVTFHRWIQQWWRDATNQNFPTVQVQVGDRIQWRQDYGTAARLAASTFKATLEARGHWHHIILDEAQDFPPEAHRLLSQVQLRVFASMAEDQRPSLCLLADENQRITSQNSTLSQIRSNHPALTSQEEYSLRQNYRNTRPIAEFAAHFYVDLPTGIPDLPETAGDKPKVVYADLNRAVDRVVNYIKAHPNEEVGVLVNYDWTRKKVFNKLKHRLSATEATVQTYSSKSREHNDASGLVFDKPGTVTALCFASSKGLEFDAVFLPELQAIRLGDAERDQIRMNLYVMCSRARRQLWLMIDDATKTHEIWKLLPPSNLYHEES